tara:strand:+ start:41 stop:619 length:579 start_codon:yes stop_codon:yes gene_type:complete
MAELIEGILKKSGGKERSIRWFRDKVRELGQVPPRTLIREGVITRRPTFGVMNFFMYDPKNKNIPEVLPYYDKFPLILPIGYQLEEGSFMGLNFHYLSIPMRLKLLNVIDQYTNNDKLDESTRIRLTWNRIKRNPLVKPVVKKYLINHIRSPFRKINADEMMVAVLLPVQRFVRAQETRVYADSRRTVNRRI